MEVYTYKTSDLATATALLVFGVEYNDIEYHGEKATFIYQDNKEIIQKIKEIALLHQSNNLQVSSLTFANNIKLIKSDIYAKRPSPKATEDK